MVRGDACAREVLCLLSMSLLMVILVSVLMLVLSAHCEGQSPVDENIRRESPCITITASVKQTHNHHK